MHPMNHAPIQLGGPSAIYATSRWNGCGQAVRPSQKLADLAQLTLTDFVATLSLTTPGRLGSFFFHSHEDSLTKILFH